MRIEEKEWNKKKSRPRDIEATYIGKKIVDEMERYEFALNMALSKHNTDNVLKIGRVIYWSDFWRSSN